MAADVRPPEDHDRFGALSRRIACVYCGHEEHILRCEELIDEPERVPCPCRRVPIPGIYP